MNTSKYTPADFNNHLLRLQPRMLNFAMILTSDRDEAYELLQHTTLHALEHADDYEEGTDFGRWARNIMRSEYMARYRHAGAPHRVVKVAFNIVETDADVPAGSYTAAELTDRLQELDEPRSNVMAMWIKGYTGREIASALHETVATVMKRIRSIRL